MGQETSAKAERTATEEEDEDHDERGGRFGQTAVKQALKDCGALGIANLSRKDIGSEMAYAIRCSYKVGTFYLIRPRQFPHLIIDCQMGVNEELIPAVNALRGEKRSMELVDMILDAVNAACDVDFSATTSDSPTLRYQLALIEEDERRLGRAMKESLDILVRVVLAAHYRMAARLGVRIRTPWG